MSTLLAVAAQRNKAMVTEEVRVSITDDQTKKG
jgi:hypothetical protein